MSQSPVKPKCTSQRGFCRGLWDPRYMACDACKKLREERPLVEEIPSRDTVKPMSDLEAAVQRLRDVLHDRDASFYQRRDISLVLDALAAATARAKRYEAALRRIDEGPTMADLHGQVTAEDIARAALNPDPDPDTKEDGDA